MTAEEFEDQYAEYDKEFKRHWRRWMFGIATFQTVLILFMVGFGESLSGRALYLVFAVLCVACGFAMHYAIQLDQDLRERYDFRCPACNLLFSRVMLKRLRSESGCPNCARRVIHN